MTDALDTPRGAPRSGSRRALVTGGAGFIGSHLADLLLARGDHVTIADNLSTGRRANLPPGSPRLRVVHASLADAITGFERDSERFDEIYHLAAAVGVRLVMDEPITSIETNVVQTIELLRFASRHATPTLVASSSEVYGKGSRSPFSEEDDVVYGSTSIARWSYGCSKAIDEHLALAHHRLHALPVVVARFFNTIGPRQVGNYGMVLPRFVHAALRAEPLLVHGTGRQTRCFCDVRDVASLLPRMIAHAPCHGRVFNVGSDEEISILDLARRVVQVLDARSEIRLVPYADAFPSGFEDLERRRPDLTRLRAAIDFRPAYGLDQTIRDVASAIRDTSPAGIVP